MGTLKQSGQVLKHTYQHFFGVMGALSLASLVASLQLYDWPLVVLGLIEWWKSIAYPVVDFLFAGILAFLSDLIQLEIRLNDVVRDYLGVGVVFCFSRFRGALFGWQRTVETDTGQVAKSDPARLFHSLRRKPAKAVIMSARTLFLWPWETIHLARLAFFARSAFPDETDEYIRGVRVSHLASLLPIFYLALLIIISWTISIASLFSTGTKLSQR